MGGAKSEVDYAVELLSHVRGSHLTGQREIEFAVDLVRFLGPNGQNVEYYRAHFETLAKCLHELRVANRPEEYEINAPRKCTVS